MGAQGRNTASTELLPTAVGSYGATGKILLYSEGTGFAEYMNPFTAEHGCDLAQGALLGLKFTADRWKAGTTDWQGKGCLVLQAHVVANIDERPILMFPSTGKASDFKGGLAILDVFPGTKVLFADRDAGWLREALGKAELKPAPVPTLQKDSNSLGWETLQEPPLHWALHLLPTEGLAQRGKPL